MDINIEQAIIWLKEQANKERFADVGIKLVIHNGEVKRIEKTIIEKSQVK